MVGLITRRNRLYFEDDPQMCFRLTCRFEDVLVFWMYCHMENASVLGHVLQSKSHYGK